MHSVRRKVVVIGDSTCGKTSLLAAYSQKLFPEVFVPTILFANIVTSVNITGRPIDLHIWDSAGSEEYDRLRPMSYPNSDVILICFDIANPQSFENVQEKWYLDVRYYIANTKYLVVGCKKDLRRDPRVIESLRKKNQTPITLEQGHAVAKQIGAYRYLECSALTGSGVDEVFDDVAHAAMAFLPNDPIKRKCQLL